MSDEIINRLRKILQENAVKDRDWDTIDSDSSIESLGFDSLSILELLYDVEEEFGVNLEAEDIIRSRNLGEVVALLKRHGV